ncbi:chorismate lyase [Stutzerimonas decontaminans]|jgi:chorismate--pyruvate lyase|uniref:Probable chorismate pyruvate-lyase n=2 Tax=Stutzerimonas TaxID=2901164 RepID=A0ABX4VTZ6_9GAMM|nr:chorismate lyase [Stutzerimonas decontaminans]AHY44531.1 chorismate--pyruvate lyase [Stutzerimonas decontaminans]MCQ4244660.1 chorismate lyase [Stutzerimonas decontaminans]PNF83438.1 chorismate lyase [Stutzerimonas decontaminans]
MPERAVSEFLDWLSADHLPSPLDPALHDWLYVDKGSLTRRLTDLANGAFSVTPLHEAWQALRADECAALGVPPESEGWVREVYLCGHGRPWVFARSVAARSQLTDSGLDLQRLGNRSLGELLFSNPAFARGTLQACHYPADWLPAERRADGLWARRSCFRQNQLGVLVTEVFLPELWQAAAITP